MAERPEIILVSTSSYRRTLITRLGLPFRCLAPRIDEDSYKNLNLNPETLARKLARVKVESVRELAPDAVLIGSDQVVSCDGTLYGKPGTADAAVKQLLDFSGRSHELITAVVIRYRDQLIEHADITTVGFRPFDRAAAERYVAADSPLDCAGSYKLESKGILLVDRIESRDETAIMGLPLITVASALREFGFLLP